MTKTITPQQKLNVALSGGVEPDARFFIKLGARSVSELAALVDGKPAGTFGDKVIDVVGSLETAGERALTYCEDAKKFAHALEYTHAGAVFVREGAQLPASFAFSPIFVKDPKAAFALAAKSLMEERRLSAGPHIPPDAQLADNVTVEPGAVIGASAQIGAGARIGANAVVHCGVAIGRNARIGSGASIQCALLGDNVVVGPNAIIGRAGFGLVTVNGESQDMPQFGRAILQDGVSLGAGSCVDRGAFTDTIVGEGTKIDNLVHVAHNVVIGRNVVIIACSGISGSVTIGDGALLAGAVGVGDHINIGAGSILAARSGVICDIPPGEVWAGYPARPRQQWLREAAWLSRAARRRRET